MATYKKILTIMAMSSLICLILLAIGGQASAAPAGFAYEKEHTITGSADGDLTNYCVNITFYNTTGSDSGLNCYLGSHIQQSLFQDLRIYDATGTIAFPIWAETASYTANSVRVWVNITDTIPQGGSYTLKIYYGNAAAASVSDGNATFPFFDDFTGASVNTTGKNGWVHWSSIGGTSAVSNGMFNMTQTIGNYNGWRSINLYNAPISIRTRLTLAEGEGQVHAGIGYNNSWGASVLTQAATKKWSTAMGGLWSVPRQTFYNDTYHIADIKIVGTTAYYSTDGVYDTQSSDHIPTAFLGAFNCLYSSSGTRTLSTDWVFIKPTTLNEPSHGTYSAEKSTPSASFSGAPTSGNMPLTVQFTDESTGVPATRQWSFGDGTANSTAPNPEHVYTVPGTYTVILTVANEYGQSSFARNNYITVSIAPPIITNIAATPNSGETQLKVQFTSTVNGYNINSYTWDFGDGHQAHEANPVHTYTKNGEYTARFTVGNAAGTDTDTLTVTVTNAYTILKKISAGTATYTPVSEDSYNELMDNTMGDNQSWQSFNFMGIATAIFSPGPDNWGPFFWILMFGAIGVFIYIKTDSVLIPGAMYLIGAGLIGPMIMPGFASIIYAVVIVGFAGLGYLLFRSR